VTLFDFPESGNTEAAASTVGPGSGSAAEPSFRIPETTCRVAFELSYDGAGFHGFAKQLGVRTVQGDIEDGLSLITQSLVATLGAGRTDAGVHARAQVMHADVPADASGEAPLLELGRMARALNSVTGNDVVIRKAAVVGPEFDARHSALLRTYRYRIMNAPVIDVFTRRYSWHVVDALNVSAMRMAGDPLIGVHDFTSFGRVARFPDGEAKTMTRTVQSIDWVEVGDGMLEMRITAHAYCYQMVRSIVGLMVACGSGKFSPGDVRWLLEARDRSLAPTIAPPHGLTLWSVTYPTPLF